MLLYIIAFIIFTYLILKAFVKIKFHFWSAQPVFHIYDLHHWLRPNKIISSALPEMNKYVNLVNIKTKRIDEMSDKQITVVCKFIRENYLRNKTAEYSPDEHHIVEYMKGANHPSYVSVYYRPKLLCEASAGSETETNIETDIYSVISARILNITMKGIGSFPLYYIDNLCVNPAMRKKGVAPKSIQTLHYHLRRANEKIHTFLFKREGEMTAIVPLTTFTTCGYDVSGIRRFELPHASMNVLEVTTKSLVLFVDFIQRHRDSYDCVVVPDVTNLGNMIDAGIISIRGILEHGKLIAVYVFRDAATLYDGQRALELVTSISACHFNEIYYAGFTQALHSCCKEWNATKVVVDGVGGNHLITQCLRERGHVPFLSSPSAFFLYNYVSYTFPPEKCFLFC